MNGDRLPAALQSFDEIGRSIGARSPAFFLDFDGTLAPLADRPDLAVLSPRVRETVRQLAKSHLVCLLSGRGLADLQALADISNVYYASDHGYRVIGPPHSGVDFEVGAAARGTLAAAASEVRRLVAGVPGVVIEEKGLSVAFHYRLTPPERRCAVEAVVRRVHLLFPSLRQTAGKLVLEFRPGDDWGKGKAMVWLVERLGHFREDVCPICLGDDLTDEDTFSEASGWGVPIVVEPLARPTCAEYALRDTTEVADFLSAFV